MTFPTISTTYPLVLASSSPRRKRLLKQLGLPFRVLASHVEENESIAGAPLATARCLAEKKARAVVERARNSWILGADTMVVLGNRILGKPLDHDEARSMLTRLGGKEHRVITGFCLLDPESSLALSEAVTTRVRFKALTDDEIDAYVATGEPFGKAGGYAIQGIGAFLVESISGSYTNVVGLPVCAVIKSLVATGALKGFPSRA
jgi:septum formation protein